MSEDSPPAVSEAPDGIGRSVSKWLLKNAAIPIAVCILTLLGQYLFNKKLQEHIAASLVKDVYTPDLSTLPAEIQKQIPLIPVRYSLRHFTGPPAHGVTIFVKSVSGVSPPDIRFTPESESHTAVQTDTNSITIDVPQIRPGGFIGFDILTAVSNKIVFSERSEDAQLFNPSDVEQRKQQTSWLQTWGIAFLVVLWIAIVSLVIAFVWRFKKWWTEYEVTGPDATFRKRLLFFVLMIVCYNILISSLGVFAGFLPIPRVSLSDLYEAVFLYLLLTRYKLIVNWLSSHTKSKDDQTEEKPTKP
jgi:hypothetical protein